MSSLGARGVTDRFYAAFDGGDIGAAVALASDELEMVDPGLGTVHGPVPFRVYLETLKRAVPNAAAVIEHTYELGDTVVVEGRFVGTFTGPLASPDGDVEPLLDRVADQRPGACPEHSMVGRELRDRILSALARLSPRERMVFELKHYHGMKLRTVADLLHTTEGTIKNTLFRATHKLRVQLAEVR